MRSFTDTNEYLKHKLNDVLKKKSFTVKEMPKERNF